MLKPVLVTAPQTVPGEIRDMATVDHPTNLTEPADAGVAPADTRPRDAFAGFHEKTWCVLLHLSVLLCFAGGIGVIGPILMWQWSREQTDSTRRHSARMINWVFTAMIALVVIFALMLIPVAVVRYLLAIPAAGIAVLSVLFPINAARKADHGELWSYPFALRLVSEEE